MGYKFPTRITSLHHSTLHLSASHTSFSLSISLCVYTQNKTNFIMLSKVSIIVAALVAVVLAGQEAPPAKAVTYNVPNVAKVTYPGPTVTRNVETYSAPSIEKTVLITRTITAPLNAPAVKSVSYSAPAVPVQAAYAAPVASYGVPAQAAYGAPALAAAPIAASYAAVAPAAVQYAAAPVAYSGYSGYAAHGLNGINGQTVYSAPALGLSLAQHQVYAAAPAVATAAVVQPAGEYGAPVAGY